MGIAFCFSLYLGYIHNLSLADEISHSRTIDVGLIQGNLSTKVKGDVSFLEANLDTYRRLTSDLLNRHLDLVVWPETVATRWMPHDLLSLSNSRFEVYPSLNTPLIYGALTYRERSEAEKLQARNWFGHDQEAFDNYVYRRFNSAVGRGSDGKIKGIFSKRVLMPFGEYLPLEDYFP